MSQYNHMNDNAEVKEVCNKCGKRFTWYEYNDVYPGGRDTEFINCPYCGAINGSIRTSGSIMTSKVDD